MIMVKWNQGSRERGREREQEKKDTTWTVYPTVVSVETDETDETRVRERREKWGNTTGIPCESSLATSFLLNL